MNADEIKVALFTDWLKTAPMWIQSCACSPLVSTAMQNAYNSGVTEALTKAEALNRRAAKVEKVEYFADFSTFIKVVNGVMVEFKGVKVCAKVGDWFGYNSAYHPITQQEYEAAKPKPASAFAIKGVPATAGECAAFIQGVDAVLGKPETRSCDHVWKGGCCIRCGAETIKPKPQMAGEGAIAIEIKRECDQCWHFDDGCPEGSDNSLHACAKWKKAYDPKYGQKAVKDLSNKETRLLVADLAKRIEVIELEMKWAQRR